MNFLTLVISAILPYSATVMVLGLPQDPSLFLQFLNVSLFFILCMGFWNAALAVIVHFTSPSVLKGNLRKYLLVFLILTLSIISLFLLQSFKLRSDPLIFYLCLGIISALGLAGSMRARKKPLAAICLLILADCITAYTTFMLLRVHFSWQALVFSIGLAGQIGSYRFCRERLNIPYLVCDYILPNPAADNTALARTVIQGRIYSTLLISGLASLAILTLLGHLHPLYLISYALLPSIIKLSEDFRKHGFNAGNVPEFHERNSRILLFITVMIPAISLVAR